MARFPGKTDLFSISPEVREGAGYFFQLRTQTNNRVYEAT